MILSALQFLIAILFSIVAAYVAGLSEGDIPIISDSALGGRAILCGHPSVTDNRNYCCMRKPDPQSNPFLKLGKLVGMEPTLCQFCCVSRFTRDRSAESGLCGMDLHFGHSLDHRLCTEEHRGSARIVH